MRWTRPLTALTAGLERFFDRALCVAGAAACAQLPEFMQHYLQRLGGHLDEARRQLAIFSRTAQEAGLTLQQYVERLSGNADHVAARTGSIVHDLAGRVDELAAAEAALRGASAWSRPILFLRYFDREIADGTWTVFRPALPMTLEGLLYALGGVGLMLAFYHGGIKWPLQRLCRAKPMKGATRFPS
ncbi:MAG: DUF2937 family protein [Verrucomicrobiota bacterium]